MVLQPLEGRVLAAMTGSAALFADVNDRIMMSFTRQCNVLSEVVLIRAFLGPIAGVAAMALLACASPAAVPEARAQLFSYGRLAQPRAGAIALVWQTVDFQPEGGVPEEGAPAFTGPAYGILYLRGNLSASVAYGPENMTGDHNARLLDISIETWNRLFTVGKSKAARLYIPLTLHSNYRRVAVTGEADAPFSSFQVTVLGLGAGLGGSAERGQKIRFAARAAPVLGVALQSFGGSTGISWLVDAGARLHVREVFGRMGVSAGYGFRVQAWRAGDANLFLETGAARLDHRGSRHSVALGLNW